MNDSDRKEDTTSECADDVLSIDEPIPLIPPPPDGGYGWVIVLASFMCNMIVDGIAYTFGVFLGEFVTYFHEGKGTIAWVGSLLSGMYLSSGPINASLCNKYGCRAVCIAGAIIGALGFVLATFSTSVTMLMLTYGVLGGIGFGMIYLPAVVAVGYYFETKRSLATGIAVCGSGVGTFAFAPLATYLLKTFDWKNSLLILAGLILNCAVFGALMRPLTFPTESKQKSLLQRMYDEKKKQLERGSIAGSFFTVQLADGTTERRMKLPANIDPGVHSSLALDLLAQQSVLYPVPTLPTISETKPEPPSPQVTSPVRRLRVRNRVSESEVSEANPHRMARNSSQPSFPTNAQGITKNVSTPAFERTRKISLGDRFKPSLSVIRGNSRSSIREPDNEIYNSRISMSIPAEKVGSMVRPFSRKDIFYSGSITNLKEYQSQKSLHGYRYSVLSFQQYERDRERPVSMQAQSETSGDKCCALPDSFKSTFGAMLDVSLIKDPAFMCVGISNFFGMAGLYVPFVYLVDAAVQDGIDPDSASLLISIIGIVNTVGRILCGYIADFPQIDALMLNNICLLISTVAVAATPFCSSYVSYVFVALFFGIAISGYISLTSIILVDLLGLDKLTNAFGLLILFRGAAAIIGSPLAGIIYDLTESYDIPFFIAGGFFGMSAVTSFLAGSYATKKDKQNFSQMQGDFLPPIDEDPFEEEDDDQPITLKPKFYQPDVERKASIGAAELKPIFESEENGRHPSVIIQNESVL